MRIDLFTVLLFETEYKLARWEIAFCTGAGRIGVGSNELLLRSNNNLRCNFKDMDRLGVKS